MATRSRDIRDADNREQETNRAISMRPDTQKEDGTVADVAAQKFLARQRALAQTAPADRVAEDHTVGTPAWFEENSPKDLHSDGGSTLAREGSVLDQAESELVDGEGVEAQKAKLTGKDLDNNDKTEQPKETNIFGK